MRVAAAVAMLLAATACGGPSATDWEELESPVEPAVSMLPPGLVALAGTAEGTELRVYDAARGSLLRRIAVPAPEGVVFSPSFAYAAEIDKAANLLRIHKLQGTAYEPVTSLNAAALGGNGLTMTGLGFVAATGRLGVELTGGDGGPRRTALLDPATPGPTLAEYSGTPAAWDSTGGPVETVQGTLRGDAEPGQVKLRVSAHEAVDAMVVTGEGGQLRYACPGPRLDPFTLVCAGAADRAELVALTVDPATHDASLRTIGTLKGARFDQVVVSPDGTRVLAGRPGGVYAAAVAGSKPKRLFKTRKTDDLTLLAWN